MEKSKLNEASYTCGLQIKDKVVEHQTMSEKVKNKRDKKLDKKRLSVKERKMDRITLDFEIF